MKRNSGGDGKGKCALCNEKFSFLPFSNSSYECHDCLKVRVNYDQMTFIILAIITDGLSQVRSRPSEPTQQPDNLFLQDLL